MIDHDAEIKLQAYLDGELPEAQGREVANWLARDSEAVGLLGELCAPVSFNGCLVVRAHRSFGCRCFRLR